MKITDGTIKKIEKRLTKLIAGQYGKNSYARVDGIRVDFIEGTHTEITIIYGKEKDGEVIFQNSADLIMLDGNADFLAGQLFQHIIENNE